ncbi:MAG: VanZ family protein [Fibrobacteria bacterium]|nr:VanZ family protein [Fibrobacteria bacterium]
MNPKLEKWAFRLAALAWMGMVFWFSSQPGTKVHVEPPLDKIIHAGVYGVLAFLLALGAGPRWKAHAAWMAWVVAVAFGASDEFHQSFSPGRSVSFGDWFADLGGATAASVAWLWAWSQGRRSTWMDRHQT